MERTTSFAATVTIDARNRVVVPVPFDPDEAWGRKDVHWVHGTVSDMRVRAALEPSGNGYAFVLGAAWRRDCGIAPGDTVTVVLIPEGLQRGDLAPDVAAALPNPTPERSSTRSRSSTARRTCGGSTAPSTVPASALSASPSWSSTSRPVARNALAEAVLRQI